MLLLSMACCSFLRFVDVAFDQRRSRFSFHVRRWQEIYVTVPVKKRGSEEQRAVVRAINQNLNLLQNQVENYTGGVKLNASANLFTLPAASHVPPSHPPPSLTPHAHYSLTRLPTHPPPP